MEKKFNEREFLKTMKQLGEITSYFSSEPTAKRFLDDVIFPHCGCDEYEVYDYMNEKIIERIPAAKKDIFNLEGWKKFYIFIIKKYRECPKLGEFLSYGVKFFQHVDTYESYFRLATEILEIDADGLMNFYTIHTLGWIKVVDTMVKIADETLGETKKVKKDSEPDVEEKVSRSEVESDKSKTEDFPVVEETVTDPMETVATGGSKTEVVEREEETGLPVNEVAEPTLPVITEPMVKKGKGKKTSEKLPDKKDKRGYDIPISQYKIGKIFPDVETASEKTGIPVEEILKSLATKPTTKVDNIWKYSQKKEVIQFTYLHTYKNQVDIENSSKSVCGKQIHRSNVSTKLNSEWTQEYKGEFVYIRISDVEISDPTMSEYSKPEITSIPEPTSEERVQPVETHTTDTVSEHIDTTYAFVDGERVRFVKLIPQVSESTEPYPIVLYNGYVEEQIKSPIPETGMESAA